MADTLNFGPEWLRALSDGNSVATPPPIPGFGGKFKLASNRYGREEMLALFHDQYKAPDELKEVPFIYTETIQKPLAFISLSEEEQRLMSQSVNSVTVLRSMGRGSGPPTRGRGGSTTDRGRGRGRGRGDSYIHRVLSTENGENSGGGFGIPGRNSNNDGWEEVGKKYDRNYVQRTGFDENIASVRREYNRSLSNENWREKTEEDDGSWRRAGGTRDKWSKDARGSWRDPNHDPQEGDRKSNGFSRDGPPGRPYQRSSESWDTEDNLPEWSTDLEDPEAVGSFDASGAFVSINEPGDVEIPDDCSKPNAKDNSKPPVSKEIQNNNHKHTENSKQKSTTSAIKKENHEIKTNINFSDSNKEISHTPVVTTKENISRASPVQTVDTKSQVIRKDIVHNKQTITKKGITTSNVKSREGDALEQMILEAENLVAKVTDEEDEFNHQNKESAIPAAQSDNSMKWLYKDPQGDVQGPFTSEEMGEWFSAGYFTMHLLIKRGCDERFQQLGELIKRWGRVPFLAGIAPPPLLNSPVTTVVTEPPVMPPVSQPMPTGTPPTEQVNVLQQQFLLQQQMLQQQLLMRQLQQQQQQQMVLQHMQEQEGFKSLPLAQQQQLVMQMMMTQPLMLQQLQQQAAQQTHRLSPLHTEQPSLASHPSFHRSMSQPTTKADSPGEETIWGGVNTSGAQPLSTGAFSQPTSVWDLEAGKQSDPADLHAQIQRMQQEMDRVRRLEDERKREEQELQVKQEEIQKQQEILMREKQEMERHRQLEHQKMEEANRQEQLRIQRQEDERKMAEEMMRQEAERQLHLKLQEERRKEEERREQEKERMIGEMRLKEQQRLEEQMRQEEKRKEEERKREEKLQKEEAKRKMEEEKRRQQEMIQQQEMMRQQELQRQRELEEQKKQEEAERQAELQRQQQEALRKLQQQQREQLSNIKLPASAQWAKQQNQANNTSNNSPSLTEIQQQEHQKWMEEEQQRQIEQQRQQVELLQQQKIQQQQQQKTTWASHVQSPASSRKSLMQIQQEEQANLMEAERKRQQSQQKQQQQQQQQQQQVQQQTKAVSLASAAAWAGQSMNNNSVSVWGTESGTSGGIWEQPVPTKKKAAAVSSEFPALKNKKSTTATKTNKTTTNGKTTKDEVVVKSLFKPQKKADEFTTWCENALHNIATSVDVPTFIAFLQDVESPYEVHDYVRSYLGETKAVIEFGKQYLEKRSQYKNKKRQEKKQQEDSIWGPAPAITPKERRPVAAEPEAQKAKGGKKKKKMQKLDGRVLGFTCHAAPDRVNAGEIENFQ